MGQQTQETSFVSNHFSSLGEHQQKKETEISRNLLEKPEAIHLLYEETNGRESLKRYINKFQTLKISQLQRASAVWTFKYAT